MTTRPLLAVLILLSAHTFAQAQLFKCKGANGQASFQDSPCAGSGPAAERKQPVPGEKNEGFAPQKKYDHGSAGNWDTSRPTTVPQRVPLPPPMAPAQASAGTPPSAPSAVEQWKQKELENQKRQAEAQAKANADTQAYNQRMERCNQARQQLGVAKEPRRIYSYDNNGDRKYVADEDRAGLVASAQQRVAESCP